MERNPTHQISAATFHRPLRKGQPCVASIIINLCIYIAVRQRKELLCIGIPHALKAKIFFATPYMGARMNETTSALSATSSQGNRFLISNAEVARLNAGVMYGSAPSLPFTARGKL